MRLFNIPIIVVSLTLTFGWPDRLAAAEIIPSPTNSTPCALTFGWGEWRPLSYIDESGKLVGLQIEFVKAIGEELECKINFVQNDWSGLVAAIEQGSIDFIPDATQTKKRLQFALFSERYRKDTFAIYVPKTERDKYDDSDLTDLINSGFRLALTRRVLYGKEIESWQNDKSSNQLLEYSDNSSEHIEKLVAMKIDGFIEDPYVMAYKFKRKQFELDMFVLPVEISSHSARFMFSKKRISAKFIIRFNEALKKVKQQPRFKTNWLRF